MIVETNRAWQRFAEENNLVSRSDSVGDDYLAVCEAAKERGEPEGALVARGIHQVLAGAIPEFVLQYPCHSPTRKQWYNLRVLPYRSRTEHWVLVVHEDISAIIAAQEDLRLKEEELRRLARARGVEEKVRFLGYVPEEDLPGLYRACDLFVLANRRLANDDMEGFGIVFLEAAASGLPVVGGNSGGVPDAVSDGVNGMLVDTEDIDALARALSTLAGDEDLRRRMGEEGRRFAEGFSWDGYSQRIRRLSDSLLR